ncbi:hypothetical protein DY102_05095 [Apilactobacillus timberlakei]|uniref:hypothetical protein n=1 Tax=Apilactobacillus timberlakei TaxID=2008380 RepID=UPI00112C81A9|nr:hypothetical protein [Apilactobacillus timberlakei]TPR23420.1 hypothetical protein DY102_05095 [Apilactobacillus timberlakei]
MQSSLKKSLYLGLAALSFASVASVTANASNANAAKKHTAAKKVTYKTTDSKLDQSVVFKSTGKNAVYNKPVGKRSVKVSKADMASKANSKNTSDLFMAYQEGVTSKGVHYYKVVSFDKKVRGFVYNKGVAKVDNRQEVANPSNTTGYLTVTNRFFNQPYGEKFAGNTLKHTYDGMNIAANQFTVSKAVKVNNDQTYYYVTSKDNSLVNGWVNSVYFSNTITKSAQDAMNTKNAVHVKFVDAANLGTLVSSADVQPNKGAYDKGASNYSSDEFNAAINKQLLNSGYTFAGVSTDGNANAATPKQGDNVTVLVNKNNTSSVVPATFAFNSVSLVNGFYTADATSGIAVQDVPSLTTDQQNELKGYKNDTFDINKVVNDIFASGKTWNVIKSGGATYTFDKDATLRAYNADKNFGNNGNNTVTFNDVFNNQIHAYYTKNTDNNDASKSTTDPNADFTTPGTQQKAAANVRAAADAFKNANGDSNAKLATAIQSVYGKNGNNDSLKNDISASKLNMSDNGDLQALNGALNPAPAYDTNTTNIDNALNGIDSTKLSDSTTEANINAVKAALKGKDLATVKSELKGNFDVSGSNGDKKSSKFANLTNTQVSNLNDIVNKLQQSDLASN